jgi:hypothetical protein
MLWKKKEKHADRSRGTPEDLIARIRRDVPRIRDQGNPPEKDPTSFAAYLCDLCNTPHPLSGLRQCTLCGRWTCESCWTGEFYICNSCNGLKKLHSLQQGRESTR